VSDDDFLFSDDERLNYIISQPEASLSPSLLYTHTPSESINFVRPIPTEHRLCIHTTPSIRNLLRPCAISNLSVRP
jgi:hypothetical protein